MDSQGDGNPKRNSSRTVASEIASQKATTNGASHISPFALSISQCRRSEGLNVGATAPSAIARSWPKLSIGVHWPSTTFGGGIGTKTFPWVVTAPVSIENEPLATTQATMKAVNPSGTNRHADIQ
jgi:hypothetical protein